MLSSCVIPNSCNSSIEDFDFKLASIFKSAGNLFLIVRNKILYSCVILVLSSCVIPNSCVSSIEDFDFVLASGRAENDADL